MNAGMLAIVIALGTMWIGWMMATGIRRTL